MKIKISSGQCTGCQRCEAICSFQNTGVIVKKNSRIRIEKEETLGRFTPNICIQCKNAKCLMACTVGAIYRDEEKDIVKVDKDKCIGCRECIEACPIDAMRFNGEYAFKCECCEGSPACVEGCFIHAIEFEE